MNQKAIILIADDDEDDCFLVQSALEACCLVNPTVFVSNGLDLLDYLRKDEEQPVGLILLDLNMPRMDGREALKVLKSDVQLRKIPVVVLTTSKAQRDVDECYELGANCYIAKPDSFEIFNDTISTLVKFWINLSQLPIVRKLRIDD